MNVGVIHNNLNIPGGRVHVCLEVIQALKEEKYKVTLFTYNKTNWKIVNNLTGIFARPDVEIIIPRINFSRLKTYNNYINFIFKNLYKNECDFLINTYGDIFPINSNINYIHHPYFARTKSHEKVSNLYKKLYTLPYKALTKWYIKKYLVKSIILTNSRYSNIMIKKHIGIKPRIVRPPVMFKDFYNVRGTRNREDKVLSVGRYSPNKKYDRILKIAKSCEDIKFVVVGASFTNSTERHYKKLNLLKNKLGLPNVLFKKNILYAKCRNASNFPEKNYLSTLTRRFCYLH